MSEKMIEKQSEELMTKEPNMFSVVFFNDDYTPFDFVETILCQVFNKTTDQAQALAASIHTKGSAVVGTYTRDIAETKCIWAIEASQQNEFPLLAKIQEA